MRRMAAVLRAIALPTVELAGLAGVVAGLVMIYLPAGLIVGGLVLVLWAQGKGLRA